MRVQVSTATILAVTVMAAAQAVSPVWADDTGGTPEPCQLRVTTIPEGGVISCDGVLRDAAPLVLGDLAPGEHLIVATKEGYNEARMSVKLDRPGQRKAVELKLEPTVGLLLIESQPPGATVEINGANRGETPLLITDMPLGDYRMAVSHSGYRTQEVDLKVDSRVPRKETVILATSSATLRLNSEPSGAKVILNGIDRGVTPCTIATIPEGESELELVLDGCEPYHETIRVAAGEDHEMTAVLKMVPAKLTVVSIPPGARVYFDNQYKGDTPLVMDGVEPGTYRLRAELPVHEPLSRTVTIQRAADVTEEFRLQPNCGAIEVVTSPAGVKVFVDGKEAGVTSAKVGETDRVSDPLRIDLVPIGTRKLLLTRKGYFNVEVPVDVQRDVTVPVQKALRRQFIPDCEVRRQNDLVRGVLMEVDPKGNVRLEIRPGVYMTIPASEVVSRRVLRADGQ